MADIIGYIGQAGTGKTTSIIKKLEEIVGGVTWDKHNAVLAITFMHGARKRLGEKLYFLRKQKIKVECLTIDSFATSLLKKFRTSCGITKQISIVPTEGNERINREGLFDYEMSWDVIREKTIELLNLKIVRDFISLSFPIIIVDEFQDCNDRLLDFIKALERTSSKILIGADGFQSLDTQANNASLEWLKNKTSLTELSTIYRTNNAKILNTASALRSNNKMSSCVEIEKSPFALAAFKISSLIYHKKWGMNNSSLAIISPVNYENSTYVKQTIDRIQQPFLFKDGTNKGAVRFPSVRIFHDTRKPISSSELINNSVGENIQIFSAQEIKCLAQHPDSLLRQSGIRIQKFMKLKGIGSLPKMEVEKFVESQQHFARSYMGGNKGNQKLFLTIHGAKNREFDYVIVLWPYEVNKDEIFQRKLLYNAVTRAKKEAIILTQHDIAKNKILSLLS